MTRDVSTEGSSPVLIFAPIGRDAALTHDFLDEASISNATCASIVDLCAHFEGRGGAALFMTEEALDYPGFPELVAVLQRQPSWSDVPVLLFGGSLGTDAARRIIRSVESLRNVTLLERPMRLAAVLSAVRAALRGRARQYELRDLLAELHNARAEAEDANRIKDDFLATLSHELRTPLNALLGWTSMLVRGQVDASRMPRVFEALDRNARAQAQLIGDVLDVSRIVTGKLQLELTTVDVSELVAQAADVVRATAAAKTLTLTVRVEPTCWVRGDASRLQQVVWNLLTNAIKFTPTAGEIRATVARIGSDVAVTVTDNGAGISPQFLPHVFERFRQADQTSTRMHSGLGLGLAIVKQLAELHGGSVTARSDGIGAGASFRVLLPAEEHVSPIAAAPSHREHGSDLNLRGRSVLIVDDNASTRDVVAAVLESSGARVEVASSAGEGWSALQRRLPDLLISDLAMPVEDGLTFIRRVRQSSEAAARLPALALSAYADARTEDEARIAGYSAFLGKPAQPQALLEIVHRLLTNVRRRHV